MIRTIAAALLALLLFPAPGASQGVRVSDLTTLGGDVPRRVMGYGLVVGLNGTGDRSLGGSNGSGHTVHSVVNLLERFGIRIPEERLRTRNVAAVLVTAEISSHARPGSRFDIQVGSIGDARSLAGGVLWMTPLTTGPESPPIASAQGAVVVDGSPGVRRVSMYSGAARVPRGGVVEVPLQADAGNAEIRFLLNDPDVVTATAIRDVINQTLGDGTAQVEDPGSVLISAVPEGSTRMDVLAQVMPLQVVVTPVARIVVDSRSGSVVAGGGLTVGPASVSHSDITLTVGDAAQANPAQAGRAHVPEGSSVQDVVSALHTAGARPDEIARILSSLQQVGALHAEVEYK